MLSLNVRDVNKGEKVDLGVHIRLNFVSGCSLD